MRFEFKTPGREDESRHDGSSSPLVDFARPIPARSESGFISSLPMFVAKEGPTLGDIFFSAYITAALLFISTVVNFVTVLVTLCYAAKQAIVQIDDGVPGTPRDWQEWEENGRKGPLPLTQIDRGVELRDLSEESCKMKTVRARFLPGAGGYEEVRVACKLVDKLEEEGFGKNVEVVECEGDNEPARLVTGERNSWTRVLK